MRAYTRKGAALMIGAPPPAVSQLADRFARHGIHYGWVVAAVTFLTMMVGACAVGAPGVLIGPLQAEFGWDVADRSEEHTSELQSLMRISYAVFCLKKQKTKK